ncbi:hypothetical protein EXU30_04045 [Shewanella maritima]|uniref:Uncharacterized protein n=1 Tax=Shewanella maritima TaxID=2520507 RepID=A0A411PET1_9GAMM|nr:hypothetical protein [Shewanella maritima]QBF81962.1 hypothetical protein EXU30_04045 [Shewanella maritima]
MQTITLTPPATVPPQIAQVLYHCYQGGSLNQLEANSYFNCENLNVLVFTLSNNYQITFNNHCESVVGKCGQDTIVQRYWLNNCCANFDLVYQVLVHQFSYKPEYRPAA